MLFAVACSSDVPPSCQQGIGHYYASGCSYFDLSTNPPTPIPETQMVMNCQTVATQISDKCRATLDDWLICNNDRPHATNSADCDCSQSYMALLSCH